MRGCEQKMRLFEVPQDMGEAWDEIENFDSDDLWSTKVLSYPPCRRRLQRCCTWARDGAHLGHHRAISGSKAPCG